MYLDKPFVDWTPEEREKYLREQYKTMLEAKRKFNAFITLKSIDEIEKELEEANGPLKGLLLPVKDNISTKDVLTTCGSKMLSNYKPPYNAHVIDVLLGAGAIVVGKTNMDEFAMGNTGETSFYGPTRNPWDTERVPGGSSSGSAVAVAWRGLMALGSDTGGSIRQPAGYTGILGLKPTYGMVSRYGLVSYAESLEQIGPFARYSRDLAMLYYYLIEPDDRDITMVDAAERNVVREKLMRIAVDDVDTQGAIDSITIAYPSNLVDEADVSIQDRFYNSLEFLRELGCYIEDIDADFLRASLAAYYIIAMVEASSNLARYDGSNYGYRIDAYNYWDMAGKTRIEGFGEEVKRRIIMGGFASSKGYEGRYYIRSLKVRRWIKDNLLKILSRYKFLALPTSPVMPPKLGEIAGPEGYIQDMYTVIPNLTGHPAISIPIGFIDGLPLGIQFIGRYYSEPELILLARAIEGKLYDPSRVPGGE